MKLRILGDSVRLRLSKSDVQTLCEQGQVADTAHFGAGAALTYTLRLDEGAADVHARLEGSHIRVSLPRAQGVAWAEGDEVGISASQSLAEDRELSLLIEKDFQCLAPRDGEEDYDGFEHPEAGTKSC